MKGSATGIEMFQILASAWFRVRDLSSNWNTKLLRQGLRGTVGTYSRAKASKCEKGDREAEERKGGERKGGKS